MSLLRLATATDIDRLVPMISAFHAHHNIDQSDDQRRATLELLFAEDIQAAIWLIGPPKAPVGYVAVSFGFSIELGGRDAMLDEFYIRTAVRGRGMGTQALITLLPMLQQMGIKAVHMETAIGNAKAQNLYRKLGFAARDQYHLMTRQM